MREELLANLKGFWKSAELVYNSGEYTSATMLYFKCWFVVLDLIIYTKKRVVPKDYSDRFRLLKEYFPSHYTSLDRQYLLYRQTYQLSVSKAKCDAVRNIVWVLLNEQKIIF